MRERGKYLFATGAALISTCIVSAAAFAASDTETLQQEIAALNNQVADLSNRVDAATKEAGTAGRVNSKWHLSGYADAGYVSSDVIGEEARFTSGHFNPAFHFQYSDRVFFEAELELETEGDGATALALEYNSINVRVNDYATLVFGKWLSPVGQFQERLHPSWINKMSTAPAGFGHGGIGPLGDIGIQLRGAVPVGETYVTYVVGMGNGPQLGHHGVELEGFTEDNNSDKALSGRIGIFVFPDLEIGLSLMKASAPGEEADAGIVTEGDFKLWGADAAFTRGGWDVRVEYLNAELGSFWGQADHEDTDTSMVPSTDWTAWYAQLAYRIPDTNFEPVVRFGDFEVEGHYAGEGERRIDVGLNYWLSPSSTIRVDVQRRAFDEPGVDDQRIVQLQFAYGF